MSLLSALKDREITLTTVPTSIIFPGSEDDPLLEIDAPPLAEIHASCIPKTSLIRCDVCGRVSFPLPEPVVIARDTLQVGVPIHRARNFTTLLVASRPIAEAAVDMGISDVALTEVGLA